METNTEHLISDQAKRVFIKNGIFSQEKPSSFDYEVATTWPSFIKSKFRSPQEIGKKAFDLWCQTKFGREFKVDAFALRPHWKLCVLKFFRMSKSWVQAKRCLRRTLKLAEENTFKAILNMKRFVADQVSNFSPFNAFVTPKVVPIAKPVLQKAMSSDSLIDPEGYKGIILESKIPVISVPVPEERGRKRDFVVKTASSLSSRSNSRVPQFREFSGINDSPFIGEDLPKSYDFWSIVFEDYLTANETSGEASVSFYGHKFAIGSVRNTLHPSFYETACDVPAPEGWDSHEEYAMLALLEYGQRNSTLRVSLKPFKQLRGFFRSDPKLFVAICKNLQPYLVIPSGDDKVGPPKGSFSVTAVKDYIAKKIIPPAAQLSAEETKRLQEIIRKAGNNKPVMPEADRLALKEFTRFPSDLFVEVFDFLEKNPDLTFKDYVEWKRAEKRELSSPQ
jgi:hypothetical protein